MPINSGTNHGKGVNEALSATHCPGTASGGFPALFTVTSRTIFQPRGYSSTDAQRQESTARQEPRRMGERGFDTHFLMQGSTTSPLHPESQTRALASLPRSAGSRTPRRARGQHAVRSLAGPAGHADLRAGVCVSQQGGGCSARGLGSSGERSQGTRSWKT